MGGSDERSGHQEGARTPADKRARESTGASMRQHGPARAQVRRRRAEGRRRRARARARMRARHLAAPVHVPSCAAVGRPRTPAAPHARRARRVASARFPLCLTRPSCATTRALRALLWQQTRSAHATETGHCLHHSGCIQTGARTHARARAATSPAAGRRHTIRRRHAREGAREGNGRRLVRKRAEGELRANRGRHG